MDAGSSHGGWETGIRVDNMNRVFKPGMESVNRSKEDAYRVKGKVFTSFFLTKDSQRLTYVVESMGSDSGVT